LGDGYTMYFGFLKYLIFCFFVLGATVGGVTVYLMKFALGDYYWLREVTLKNIAAKLSIDAILKENITYTDIIMGLNILGVVFLTFFSVYVRRKLSAMAEILDENEVTPSDFALLVRHLPLDWTQEKLKSVIEEHFKQLDIKVNYVNFCYEIAEMIKLN
jgi:hypothetical protein